MLGNPVRSGAEVVGVVGESSGREQAGIDERGFRNCFRAEAEQFWAMTHWVAERAGSPQVRLFPEYGVRG